MRAVPPVAETAIVPVTVRLSDWVNVPAETETLLLIVLVPLPEKVVVPAPALVKL